MAEARVGVIIEAEDRASSVISNVNAKLKDLKPAFEQMAKVGTIAFAAISGEMFTAVKAAGEAQLEMANFNGALDTMAGHALTVSTGLTKTVSTMKVTGIEADKLKNSIDEARLAINSKNMALSTLQTQLSKGKISQSEFTQRTGELKNQIASLNLSIKEHEGALAGVDVKHIALTKTVRITAEQVQQAKEAFLKAAEASTKLGFDDEAAANSMARFYQATGNTTKSLELHRLAMDMARAKGIGLEEATMAISKALAGSTKELKAYGIVLDDNATSTQILSEITHLFGGRAQQVVGTLPVQLEILTTSFGNLQEAIGDVFTKAGGDFLLRISNIIDQVKKWVEVHPELTKNLFLAGLALSGFVAAVGILGLVLPSIIAGFSLLLSPITLVVVGIGAVIASVILFRDEWAQAFAMLEEKTGLVTFLKDAWNGLVETFRTMLMPALNDLWVSITPLLPYLKMVGEFIGVGLVVFVGLLVKGLQAIVATVSLVINAFTGMVNWFNANLLPIFVTVGNAISSVISKVEALISALSRLNVAQGIGNFVSGMGAKVGNVLGINDGIVQNGQIITTHPDDYIIATKTPQTLGGGGAININISGAVLTDDAARIMGNMIIGQLQLQMKH